MKSVIRPAARNDILRQFRYYLNEQNAAEIAFRFLESVELTVSQLLEMPLMGMEKQLRNRSLAGLHVWPLEGFKDIRMYYQIFGDTLRVIRVLHGKRDIERILETETVEKA